jgi:hypothetical protein
MSGERNKRTRKRTRLATSFVGWWIPGDRLSPRLPARAPRPWCARTRSGPVGYLRRRCPRHAGMGASTRTSGLKLGGPAPVKSHRRARGDAREEPFRQGHAGGAAPRRDRRHLERLRFAHRVSCSIWESRKRHLATTSRPHRRAGLDRNRGRRFGRLSPPSAQHRDREFEFEGRDGQLRRERIVLSDGGLFDNLGTSCLEPGRSADHSYNVFDVDYIVTCDAGRGLLDDAFPWALSLALVAPSRPPIAKSRTPIAAVCTISPQRAGLPVSRRHTSASRTRACLELRLISSYGSRWPPIRPTSRR